MNLANARLFVRKNPKRIEGFVRAKLAPGVVARTTSINFIRYDFDSFTGHNWRYGYSIGDGRVYGHKAVQNEAGEWIDSPNLETVCAEITSGDDEFFILTISDDRGAKRTHAPISPDYRLAFSGES